MIALASVRTLSVGDPISMALRIAVVRSDGVVRMSKKFAARTRLARELLLLAVAVYRFIEVVVEILSKAVNCDARQLQIQVQVT
jgi:hypothetical protein